MAQFLVAPEIYWCGICEGIMRVHFVEIVNFFHDVDIPFVVFVLIDVVRCSEAYKHGAEES